MDGRVENMFLEYLTKHEVDQELEPYVKYIQEFENVFPTAFY